MCSSTIVILIRVGCHFSYLSFGFRLIPLKMDPGEIGVVISDLTFMGGLFIL
jgi:hypothetical protein